MFSRFEQRVQNGQELSHASDMDYEIGFAGVFEPLREGCDHGVKASGGERGHVERGSDIGSPPRDAASPFEFSAVVVIGSQSPESTDLGPIDRAQFRDLGQELSGGVVTDPWNAGEDLVSGIPVVIGIEQFGDGLFDGLELFVAHQEGLFNALEWDLSPRGLLSVLLHGLELDQLSSSRDEILEFLLVFRCFGSQAGLNEFRKVGQITGIDRVGLGAVSQALGEVSGLSGIDDGHRLSGVNEIAHERSLVTTGGFNDDELQGGELLQLPQQLFMSLEIIRERIPLGQRSHVDVELMFGDINTDPGWNADRSGSCDGVNPVLQMRTRLGFRGTVLAAVRAGTKGVAAILLCDGVLSTWAQSICRAPGSLRLFAGAQSRRLPGLQYTSFTSF